MSSKELLGNDASLAYATALYKIGDLLLDAQECDRWRRESNLSDESAAHLAAVATIRREAAVHLANIAFFCFKAEDGESPEII